MKKIDLGEIIRKRIVVFPALKDEPKKGPPAWGVFRPFTLTEEQLAPSLEYRYPVSLFSASSATLQAMLDRAIGVGLELIEINDWEFRLHATSMTPIMRVKGKQLFEIRLTYIFRVKKLVFAPAESDSSVIVEIPKEPMPEDLEATPKEEVKNG